MRIRNQREISVGSVRRGDTVRVTFWNNEIQISRTGTVAEIIGDPGHRFWLTKSGYEIMADTYAGYKLKVTLLNQNDPNTLEGL